MRAATASTAGHDASGAGQAAAGFSGTGEAAQAGISGADRGVAGRDAGSAPMLDSGASPTAQTMSSGSPEPASCQGTEPDAAPVIYVVGDSTASVYGEDLYPRMGWAQPLQDYFKPACATVRDEALSGRSSKSFVDEGAWEPIKRALRAGDFVLIQFGHNDEKREDSARYTQPFGSYQQYLSLFIDDALAQDATPILLTSIERNKWSNGKLSDTHGDYPRAVRELAQARDLTLVDMTELTHHYFERIGESASTKLFMNLGPGESPNYPGGNSDNTHLQETGARVVAEIALAELARQRAPIAALLDHVVPAP